jgi:uncharacterized protein (TIGR03086 family)
MTETPVRTDITELHRRALEDTRALVAEVGPGDWALPTPDDDWDVRALINHVVSGNLWTAELAAGRTIDEVGEQLDGDLLGDEPLAAYDKSAAAAAAAFEAPGALDAPCAVSYGPVPGSVYASHRFVDVLVHGWDLAVALGRNSNLDPELVAAALEMVEPVADMLRASGSYGGHIDVASDADPQTRLLALLGRRQPQGPSRTPR